MKQLRFDIADLQAMVAVVERGGFRAAASAINLSQPALSRRIDKLEEALNVRLFERTTRRVALTVVGREFYAKAQEILANVESSLLSISDIAASSGGEVIIACVPSVAYHYLPPVIRQFNAIYPNIRIKVIDEGANEVLNGVTRGEADFGINFIGAQQADIDFEKIMSERFVLACLHDHPLAQRRSVKWREIDKYPYVAVARSSGNRLVLDQALATAEVRPSAVYEVRHVATSLAWVAAGLGIAAVPHLAMPPQDGSPLIAVPLVEPKVERTLGLIRKKGRKLSSSAQYLYDALKNKPPRPFQA
jgi:DNA-binding transcriptional LysR family regulator